MTSQLSGANRMRMIVPNGVHNTPTGPVLDITRIHEPNDKFYLMFAALGLLMRSEQTLYKSWGLEEDYL